ncbi:hypothetical protein METBIDRAFT_33613 [Metschnikowia bicuspidata var. bicuspidata NRRL YB-4993]|uniref:Uncharacterized protein n=1 Tax=Metschnikowia bicuspidata var. bicuspidata NRRL YB-4993 TaxID=869754 RepID=A0A1A0H4W0_9ASCO|nr:hypothetical protein METBIDRAFT_33613 [Metschnikowia bicuspidata var. bicuspidata NRRL YB-4993]OBA18985.1 hypothetical protein METBIDRAFT_33613 [Metschnikowia bicuspidata var. bicuspidata NRRL YB-4993]
MPPVSEKGLEVTSSNEQNVSNLQVSQQQGPRSGRNRQKKIGRDGNKSIKNGPKDKKSTTPKGQEAKKQKPKSKLKDFRFLEVVKLVRKHLPITINGCSVTKIGTDVPKNLSRKAKEAIVVNHIQNVINRDPQQPIYLSFIVKPADPDFPFELDLLNFSLTVPAEYPHNTKAVPSIVVLNTDIPRGFSVNIERGYRTIVNLTKPKKLIPTEAEQIQLVDGKGLLSQIQTLNKYLELFLLQEKRQTMKFITFKNSEKSSALSTSSLTPTPVPTPQPLQKVDLAAVAFEDEQVTVTEATRLKREFYIGEMTQKLGLSVKLFNRSKTEARYKVQIPIVNTENVPQLWAYRNHMVDVFVTVPSSYPETPIRAIIASNFSSNLLVAKKNALVSEGHDLIDLVGAARVAEKHFNRNVNDTARTNITGLVQHLNWISNHLNLLVSSEGLYKEYVAQMRSLKDV